MGKLKDLTGKKFGKLVVIKFAGYKKCNNGRNKAIWSCKCECGNIKDILGNDLTSGRTISCGCYRGHGKNKGNKAINWKRKKNTYNLSGEYGIGYTDTGEKFYFDLEDYDKIKDYSWSINDGYVTATFNYRHIWMHRLVMGISDNEEKNVDHIKHVKYDNRKSELRVVDVSKNNMNREIRSDNTSGITGVCWNKKCNKWMSYICVYGKRKTLGYFENKDDAIRTRREAEEKYFGEYSYHNSTNS